MALSEASRQRLAAMGISVWQRRARPALAPALTAAPDAPAALPTAGPRVRLSSGTGEWLLVQRQPWRGQHEALLADIRATIGIERCCFGQWAGDTTAGEDFEALADRGIRHILAFGPTPAGLAWPGLLAAPALDELASDGAARRALWRLIAPVLAA